MNSCAIIPKVKDRNGKIVDSKLFKDLLSYLSVRKTARHIYLITKGEEFIQKFMSRLKLDENGEPTLRSLLKETNLDTYITEEKVLKRLNKDIGRFHKDTDKPIQLERTSKNYQTLAEKAVNFNLNSEFKDEYVAVVVPSADSKNNKLYYELEVKRKTKELAAQAKNADANTILNNRLREILQSKGISIGALNELERRLGVKGVTDFSMAKTITEGMVELIRLAEGAEGERVLPEEFAHFAIEAMESNPLVERLINLIYSKDLTREILGEDYGVYSALYKNNDIKMAKEAAGKLLAKHLLQHVEIPQKSYKNFLTRVIDAVKAFFRKLSASQFQKAMIEADSGFSTLAADILSGSMDKQIKVENIKESELYYNTAERIARDQKLLEKIIENEVKRYAIYSKRSPGSRFNTAQEQFIYELKAHLAANIEIEGIYKFLEHALGELNALNTRLIQAQSTPGSTVNDKAKVLRDIRNYLHSFEHIFKDIRYRLLDEEKLADNRYGDRVRVVLEDASQLLNDLFSEYDKCAKPLFVDFIKPIIGDGLVVPFGKDKGKRLTAESLIESADRDITIFDRWLDSMADSSDAMLGILDRLVKNAKETARLDVIDISKRIAKAHMLLEQAGVKDTLWMFEKDSNGNITGAYIQEINWGLYIEKKKEFISQLKSKYGESPTGNNRNLFNAELRKWFSDNLEVVGGKSRPKYSIYKNTVYENLNDAQRAYYETMMSIKEALDSYLPESATYKYNTIKIRKDLIERVKKSKDVTSGAKQLWESVKDSFIRRSDDSEFIERSTIMDFEGHEVQTLPIYYTQLKVGESENDVSTDVTSTMIAYAAMAVDFREMNKIIDALELGRDILRERKIVQTSGNKQIKEVINEFGTKVERFLTKSGDETNAMQRINDFFGMQVYGRYMKDEGTLFGTDIDVGKLANNLNAITALNSLAVNVLSGISNVATGTVMMNIEAFAHEFFREGDVVKADAIYAEALPEYLAEVGNRVKTSKLALWDELFNVLQEYETEIKETNFDRKTWFSRMFGDSALYLLNNAGEHWMQNRTSLALASQFKMKGPNNEIVNLWDAMEVVYIDPNNKKLGASLKVKKGFTKLDGTEFTKQDIIDFSRKSASINERMHGIYNYADRMALQKLAVGRMAILFRKWIRPSLNRRFKGVRYNFDTGVWEEGYYDTTGRFLTQIAKELKEGQFNLIANFDKLTTKEKQNIRRALSEVGHLILLLAILGFIDWDNNDEDNYFLSMLEYQTRRLYTEIGALIPGPTMLYEGLRILKSPMAGVNTMEDTLNLIKLLNPYNYEFWAGEEALLQSGRYKGESRAVKYFFESPLVPMSSTIYKGLYPEEGIPFYKQ